MSTAISQVSEDYPDLADIMEASGPLRLSMRQAAVLSMFGYSTGYSDEQLVADYQMEVEGGNLPEQSESGIRTRRAELRDLGLIEDAGYEGRTNRGRPCTIFSCTMKGLDLLDGIPVS